MTAIHTYIVKGMWNKHESHVGQITGDYLSTNISIGANLNGPGVGASPEELLLSAAASCYMITLSLLLENRNVSYRYIDLESKAYVESDKGLRIDSIVHHPHILVQGSANVDKILTLAHYAEHTCMVSSALRGNVEISVSPKVTLEEATQNA